MKNCNHEKIEMRRKEVVYVYYQLDEKGKYHEYKDEMIDSDIIKIKCSICGKELKEEDINF